MAKKKVKGGAIRVQQYAQELEKGLAGNKSFKTAHETAAEKARVRAAKAKKAEESLIAKTKKHLAKLFGKKKEVVKPTASEKRIVKKRLKKKYPQMAKAGWGKPKKITKRTKQVSKQLANAGLTEKEIAKFRKK